MNNHEPESERLDDEMLAEYDFTGGFRGKHHEAYRQGHTVTIHQTDGTTVVQTTRQAALPPRLKQKFSINMA
jgi:hypothetical protein